MDDEEFAEMLENLRAEMGSYEELIEEIRAEADSHDELIAEMKAETRPKEEVIAEMIGNYDPDLPAFKGVSLQSWEAIAGNFVNGAYRIMEEAETTFWQKRAAEEMKLREFREQAAAMLEAQNNE